jgi:hypothetical protein
MIPHDILTQLFDRPPSDDSITWDSDVIRITSPTYQRRTYTRVDINLSQGIIYFFQSTAIIHKLAIQLTLVPITTAQPQDSADEPESSEDE